MMRDSLDATWGFISYVGVPHGVELDGAELFYTHVYLYGGPAPVRRNLPELIQLVQNGSINPGKVFDLELPLEQAAEGYRAWTSAARSRRDQVGCRLRASWQLSRY